MPKGVKGFQKGNKEWTRWKSRPDYSGENNPNFGRQHTPEEIKLISEKARKGPNHKDWKGDKAGRPALHDYVKRYLPKPKSCNRCHHKYTRDISGWEWICKSCHAKKDIRLLNLKNTSNEGYIESIRKR